jgi:tetratricopeptide (TPR) repeat protein
LAAWFAGRDDLVKEEAMALTQEGTTDLVPHLMLALASGETLKDFVKKALTFVGEDEFTFLELSLVFAELGQFKTAADLLEAYIRETKETRRPLPYYYLAYYFACMDKEEEARSFLKQGASLACDYVFPSRPEAVWVLKYATENNPEDSRAFLYLGNLLAGLGRLEEAKTNWQAAVDLDGTLSVALRNLGLYAWKKSNDLEGAAGWYEKAITARPSDPVLYRDLARILIQQGKQKEAIALLEGLPAKAHRRADVILELAQAYNREGRYTDTIHLLESETFSNWEGHKASWNTFHRARLERGKLCFEQKDIQTALEDFNRALSYPENLGVGRPEKPEEAEAYYWKGKALFALDQKVKALLAWRKGVEGHSGSERQNEYQERCLEALEEQALQQE